LHLCRRKLLEVAEGRKKRPSGLPGRIAVSDDQRLAEV
jgi:hypothetical protein